MTNLSLPLSPTKATSAVLPLGSHVSDNTQVMANKSESQNMFYLSTFPSKSDKLIHSHNDQDKSVPLPEVTFTL